MSKKTVKTKKNTEATVTALVTPEATNVGPIGPKAKAKKIAAPAAPVATIAAPVAAEVTSKRITPGAAISEWRVVRSQRTAQPGWFLQGGSYQMKPNGRNAFVCGYESFHPEKSEAFAALAKQTPAAA